MSLSTIIAQVSLAGDGVTTAFSFPYKYISHDDFQVDLELISTQALSRQTLDSDYTVTATGVADNGVYPSATITFTTAPSALYSVIITRNPVLTQEFDFNAEGAPLPVITRYADYVEMKLQALSQRVEDSSAESGSAVIAAGSPTPRSLSVRFVANLADYVLTADVGDYGLALQRAYTHLGGLSNGGVLEVDPGSYDLKTAVTGASKVKIVGLGGKPEVDNSSGAIFVNAISGDHSAINFPGVTYDWGFENIGFSGADKNAPFVNVTPSASAPYYGAYGIRLYDCVAEHCRPWIYAEHSFDWVIDSCDTNLCGNVATGTGSQVSSLYFYNSTIAAASDCNNIRIHNCFIDVSTGYGVFSDSSGAGLCNTDFYIKGCHFEKHSGVGYPAIKGDLDGTIISGNVFHLSGSIMVDLTNDNGKSPGANRVLGNRFFSPTTYAVRTNCIRDIIAHNNSFKATDAYQHFALGASATRCRVIDNSINTSSGANIAVTDAGSTNIVYGNNDDLTVDTASIAMKLFGTQYYVPLITARGAVPNVARKASDETRTSTTTLTADSALTFAMLANKTYRIRIIVFFDTTDAADFKYSFTGPSSPTLLRISNRLLLPSGTSFNLNRVDTTYTGASAVGTGTMGGYLEAEGIVQNGANAGNFSLLWAQNTSDASNTTVLGGSSLEWQIMN